MAARNNGGRVHVSADGKVRPCTAKTPETCTASNEHYASKEEYYEKVAAANEGNLISKKSKKKDVSDMSWQERTELANNPNTPAETLTILAGDENEEVKVGVVGNPNTPAEAFDILAKDETNKMRAGAAVSSKTSPESLNLLASDKNDSIRLIAAYNRNTPDNALIKLLKDENGYVREAAVETLYNKNIKQ